MPFQTMGFASKDHIRVRGFDLASELIGRIDFTDMFFLELMGRVPTQAERTVLGGVLVALTEHGLTPSAIATRLTDLGAPGAMQGAVAAGLLGAGDRFLGALDGCARILQEWPESGDPQDHAKALADTWRQRRARIPGLGHPTHVDGDPRTPVLFALAERAGVGTTMRTRVEELQRAAESLAGRPLPVNVDGACAALLSEIGIPWPVTRGVALVARAAGLVGHLFDEWRNPTAEQSWLAIEHHVSYREPNNDNGSND